MHSNRRTGNLAVYIRRFKMSQTSVHYQSYKHESYCIARSLQGTQHSRGLAITSRSPGFAHFSACKPRGGAADRGARWRGGSPGS